LERGVAKKPNWKSRLLAQGVGQVSDQTSNRGKRVERKRKEKGRGGTKGLQRAFDN